MFKIEQVICPHDGLLELVGYKPGQTVKCPVCRQVVTVKEPEPELQEERGDIEKNRRLLIDYMSDLSEQAYAAAWMAGLEYDLWGAVVNGPREYGRTGIMIADILKLSELAKSAGGWIYFDENSEGDGETFIPMDQWLRRYERHLARESKE